MLGPTLRLALPALALAGLTLLLTGLLLARLFLGWLLLSRSTTLLLTGLVLVAWRLAASFLAPVAVISRFDLVAV